MVEIRENENRRSDISNFENDVKIAKSSTSNIEQFCVFLQPLFNFIILNQFQMGHDTGSQTFLQFMSLKLELFSK